MSYYQINSKKPFKKTVHFCASICTPVRLEVRVILWHTVLVIWFCIGNKLPINDHLQNAVASNSYNALVVDDRRICGQVVRASASRNRTKGEKACSRLEDDMQLL